MKKRLLPLAALALSSMSAFAQYAESADTKIYDLSKFGDNILEVFYTALQDGRKYPTMEEFKAFGIDPVEVSFVRSHVRPRSILLDHAKDINQDVYPGRRLWMNVPIGIGKETGGYPNNNLGDDTFTGWNYTHVFGSWNHGLFHVPGVAGDAAHKHGTDLYSGIKFFDTTGNPGGTDASGWLGFIMAGDTKGYGGFKYVEPLINCLMYFGQDGINYNWEAGQIDVATPFHKACYRLAKERGFNNFHIGIYSFSADLNAYNVDNLLGTIEEGKTADAFLNYVGDFFSSNTDRNVSAAEQYFGSAEDVYQGTWIVTMKRNWNVLTKNETAKKIGIVLWGEHSESRLHSYCTGTDNVDFHDNYQRLQDRFFSGGYRNPAVRPSTANSSDWSDGLSQFQGLAEYVPERTVLRQNLPFYTNFNTGAGERYNYKGKKTAGKWYNLGNQDYVPTYRWLVYDKGTTTALYNNIPEFTAADSYNGGTCLRLKNTKAVDIVLYRSELTCSAGQPTATIALKRWEGAPEGTVSVIVKKQGSDEWLETAFANVESNGWEEQTLPLNGVAEGDVIEYIGLRTSGDTDGLLVGTLALNDDVRLEPAGIASAVIDVKEETPTSLSLKMAWEVDAEAKDRADWNLLYNDEANIDHFEILYKDGEDGRISEIGRTSSWSTYIGNLPLTEDEDPWIGIRTASIDGKHYSPTHWIQIERADASQLPEPADLYPISQIDPSSDGYQTALASRWFKEVKTEGAEKELSVSYASSPASNFNYARVAEKFTVRQGATVKLSWTDANTGDGLLYCTGRGYADWDLNRSFDATSDEVIWECGESNAKKQNSDYWPVDKKYENAKVSFSFTVPEDAVPGESRVRLVFSDAWFPHPGPDGYTSKGFTIDLPMEVVGDNLGRGQAIDKHDTGVADEPAQKIYDPLEGIAAIKGKGVSVAALKGRDIQLENVENAWIYNAEGQIMGTSNGQSINTTGWAPGVYLVRMQNGSVIRTGKVIVK